MMHTSYLLLFFMLIMYAIVLLALESGCPFCFIINSHIISQVPHSAKEDLCVHVYTEKGML